MAPRKRKAEGGGEEKSGKPKTTAVTTRSMALAGTSDGGEVASKKQRGKATTKKNKAKGAEAEAKVVDEEEEEDHEEKKTVVVEHCKQCNSFKTRALQVKGGLEKAVPGVNVLLNPDKVLVGIFQDDAKQLVGSQILLSHEKQMEIYASKPRRGCFEIREEGGEKFISLLDMKRPFKPMKDLDMEEVIVDIVEKIKA